MKDNAFEIDESEEKDAENMRRLENLAESLLQKRQEAIEGRINSGVERRMREDEDAFEGIDDTNRTIGMIDYATKTAPLQPPARSKTPNRSIVAINIVRSKSEMAEGRFSDILLPVDDKNWGLKITPYPEMAMDLKDDRPAIKTDGSPLVNPDTNQQATNADVAKAKKEEAKSKMLLMETEVDDQLTECVFNGESRKCIKDAIRIGTCVLKGPNVVKRLKKQWTPQTDGERVLHMLNMTEDMQPASKRVDPWNIYPDPNCGEDPHDGAYIWERDFILEREVRRLVGVDGYIDSQLLKVLEESPKRLNVAYNDRNKSLDIKFEAVSKGKAYEVWEYYGDVDRDDLEAMGCDCDVFDPRFRSLSAQVLFINDRPVKIQLNTLDTGDMPYDFFQWTTVSGSCWGIGIPRILIWLSRIIIAAWRAMMDNAGDSAGANIVIGNGIEPDDGHWVVTGKKIWRAVGDDIQDVQKAFAQFQIENNQQNFERVIRLALEFVDMETSLPMLFQGEKGETPETLGATNIMVDANNVGLRPRVKLWDDKITTPHLTRYYDWNMQYNKREEIKGDYNVDARGTSVLLARDQMVQTLLPIMKLREDKLFSGLVDWKKAVKQLLSAMKLDILKSDEDIEKWEQEQREKPPEVDPRIQGDIQIAQMRAQYAERLETIKAEKENQMMEMKEQIAERDRQLQRALKAMDFQMKILEYSEKRNINLDKVKADLASAAAKLNVQVELAHSKMTGPQITTPPVEPEGRAKDGRAFPD